MLQNSYRLIAASADRFAGRTALRFIASPEGDEVAAWTYAELVGRITAFANGLHLLGVDRTSVVAFALPNLAETHVALWGAEAVGIALPLNPALGVATLAAILREAGASVLVTQASAITLSPSELEALLSAVPSLSHLILVDSPASAVCAGTVAVHDFDALCTASDRDRLRFADARSSDDSSWFCTGGTTGLPKIARRSHANELANVAQIATAVTGLLGEGDAMLSGLPMFHVNAAMVSGLLPFAIGGEVVLATAMGFRTPGLLARFWPLVDRFGITSFSAVPTLLSALAQIPKPEGAGASLRFAICGAAPLSAAQHAVAERALGVPVLEGYGLTEGTCATSLNPADDRRPGSIGRVLPGQRARPMILDDDGRWVRDAAVGEVGALAISGDNVFIGYRSAAHDRGIWIDHPYGRRWLNTGDLARIDADGYLWLTGRAKDLIIRGGHNIDPAVIEEALSSHPAVLLAAAVGRPDAHAGEVPVAFVQLRPDAMVDETALLAFAEAAIDERAARPKGVRILPALPLTAVGKIFKPELRRLAAEEAN